MLCCHSRFLDQGSEATGLPERMSCCDLSVSPRGLARRGRFRLRCTQRLMSPQIVWDIELSCCRVFEMHKVLKLLLRSQTTDYSTEKLLRSQSLQSVTQAVQCVVARRAAGVHLVRRLRGCSPER